MSLKRIAALIPKEYRKEILELNIIEHSAFENGVPNGSMNHLIIIWKDYVEPDFKAECNRCITRMMDNYKALKPTLMEMHKEEKLLNEL